MKVSEKEYNSLLANHQGYLFTIIKKRIFSYEDAQDALQMCNQYIMDRYDKFDCAEIKESELIPRFKGWIAAFARNSISKWLRKNLKFKQEVTNDEVYNVVLETIGDFDPEFLRKDEEERLSEVKYSLDFHSRDLNKHELEVFNKLREGLNLRQIGSLYGVSHQAIQQVREKIYKKIRRSFNSCDTILDVSEIPEHLKVLKNFFKKSSRGAGQKLKRESILKSKLIDKLLFEDKLSIENIAKKLRVGDRTIRNYLSENNLVSPYKVFVKKIIEKRDDFFILKFSGKEVYFDEVLFKFVNKFKHLFTSGNGNECPFSINLKKDFAKLMAFVKKEYDLDLSEFKERKLKTRQTIMFFYELYKGKLLEKGQSVCYKTLPEKNVFDLRLKNIKYKARDKNSSKYRGVFKNGKSWRVKFTYNGLKYNFGGFKSQKKAAKAYNEKITSVRGTKGAQPFLNNI
jgi:RNA polymerase sigma factor (sigma-70 family)